VLKLVEDLLRCPAPDQIIDPCVEDHGARAVSR
jgi:hypothetical protein